MIIKKILILLLPLLLLSCATTGREEVTNKNVGDEESRLFMALAYFNFSEYALQEGDIDNAWQLLRLAHDTYPESIYLKEKMLMYLSPKAFRDSTAAQYMLQLGAQWYASGVYNSRIMFSLGELSLYRRELAEADIYLAASLYEEAEKECYLTYYMFEKLYNPPADTLLLGKAIAEPWADKDKDIIYRVADIYKENGEDSLAYDLLYKAYLRWEEPHILQNLVALQQYQEHLDDKVESILLNLLAAGNLSSQLLEYLVTEYYTQQEYGKVIALEQECRRLGDEYILKILYLSAIESQAYEMAIEVGNLLLLLEGISPDQHYLILGKLWEMELSRDNLKEAARYLSMIKDLRQQYVIIKMVAEELNAWNDVVSFLEYYYQNAEDSSGALFLLLLANRDAGNESRIPELLSLLDPEYVLEHDLIVLLALPFNEETGNVEAGEKGFYISFLQQNPLLAGLFYYYIGDDEQALFSMRQALLEGEHSLEMLLMYGNILEKAGDEEELHRILKQAVALYPEEAVMLNFYGYMAADLQWANEYNKAKPALLKALELEPDNAMYWDSLGWLYYRMGHYAEAKTAMLKTTEVAQVNADIALHYGIILASNGDTDKAREYLQLVITLTEDEEMLTEANKHLAALDKE
ncbi:MAG: hypothetical protein K9N06_08260 [Candidatus Cloacimonetes bacterium]|nr:hypothetical protein [Candidatus Cloacimonadota bacterium]